MNRNSTTPGFPETVLVESRLDEAGLLLLIVHLGVCPTQQELKGYLSSNLGGTLYPAMAKLE